MDDRLQELETSFCRDFTCCGQHLPDLHDLLHHYEEHHACCSSEMEEAAPVSTTIETPSNQQPNGSSTMLDSLALDMLCSNDLATTIDPINTFFATAATFPVTQDDFELVNESQSNSESSSSSVSDDELRTPTSPMSPQQQPLWLDPTNNNNLDWLMRVNHALLAADACAEG